MMVAPYCFATGLVFTSTATPLNTADQAAKPVWLIGRRPRAALSVNTVVNSSNNVRSIAGRE